MTHKLCIASFDSPEDLLSATRAARESGRKIYDTYVPWPVHGLEEAMGVARSRLGVVCFMLGSLGVATALGFQLWVSTRSWPLNIGGKPFDALPALIPITFELMVLFAAVGTIIVFFIRSRLWPGAQPGIALEGATNDRFILALETNADDAEEIAGFVRDRGAAEVREVDLP